MKKKDGEWHSRRQRFKKIWEVFIPGRIGKSNESGLIPSWKISRMVHGQKCSLTIQTDDAKIVVPSWRNRKTLTPTGGSPAREEAHTTTEQYWPQVVRLQFTVSKTSLSFETYGLVLNVYGWCQVKHPCVKSSSRMTFPNACLILKHGTWQDLSPVVPGVCPMVCGGKTRDMTGS